MVLGIPSVHGFQILLRLFNYSLKLIQLREVEVGDDRGDFDDDFFVHIKARHLHIDPE